MEKFWKLTKFNMSYYLKPRFESTKDKRKFISMIVILGLCFLMPIAMMVASIYMATSMAIQMGVVADFISIILFSAQVAVIFMGTAGYLQIMFFSQDNKILASMPIKYSHIYMSKLIVSIFSNMLMSAIITIPSLIVIAVALNKAGMALGAGYYLLIPIAVIFTPLIALLVISILAFPLMKILTYLRKHPTLAALVATLLTVVLLLLIYIPMMGSLPKDEDGSLVTDNMVQLFSKIGRFSYPTHCLAKAMIGENAVANFFIFFGITLACFCVGVGLSTLFFKSTLVSMNEGTGLTKSAKNQAETKQNKPLVAMMNREIKCVMRDTHIAMQTFMMIFIVPVLLVVAKFMTKGNNEGVTNPAMFQLAMSFFYCDMMIGGMNYLAIIGISRERDKFGLLKTMPIDSRTIMKAKLLLADICTILAICVSAIVFCFVSSGAWYDKIVFPIALIGTCTPLNAFALLRDTKKPNLKWMNVKEITKNNMGTFIPTMLGLVEGMVIVILGVALSMLKIAVWQSSLIFWAAVCVIILIYYFIFRYKKLDKMVEYFDNIQP